MPVTASHNCVAPMRLRRISSMAKPYVIEDSSSSVVFTATSGRSNRSAPDGPAAKLRPSTP